MSDALTSKPEVSDKKFAERLERQANREYVTGAPDEPSDD